MLGPVSCCVLARHYSNGRSTSSTVRSSDCFHHATVPIAIVKPALCVHEASELITLSHSVDAAFEDRADDIPIAPPEPEAFGAASTRIEYANDPMTRFLEYSHD